MKDKVNLIFGSVLSVLAALILYTFTNIDGEIKSRGAKFSHSLDQLRSSVTSLNNNIVEITTNQGWVKNGMKKLDTRVHELEIRVLDLEKQNN